MASGASSAADLSGRFITLEGGEGVGKSTQAAALVAALAARDIRAIRTREPGGSPGAEAIRQLLLTGAGDRWTSETEALLFAAARADHVARTIRPALADGIWVICDRFVDSSLAYQGGADGFGGARIRTLHEIGSGGFMPDRTLLLTLPEDLAAAREAERDAGKPDRFGARDPAYHRTVVASFHALAEAEPARWRVIDGAGPADAVTVRLLAAIEDLL